jgi:hypothetical protein
VVEGTSLLRKHMGLNLYRGFESLRLRQESRKQAAFGPLFLLYPCFNPSSRYRQSKKLIRIGNLVPTAVFFQAVHSRLGLKAPIPYSWDSPNINNPIKYLAIVSAGTLQKSRPNSKAGRSSMFSHRLQASQSTSWPRLSCGGHANIQPPIWPSKSVVSGRILLRSLTRH